MTKHITQIVDEQIKRWNLEQQGRANERKAKEDFVAPNVITLSNALGSNGIAIANKVGQLMNVPVYDREIVEHIATTKKVRVETVETLDERAQSTLDDYLTNLFRERNFDQSDYLQALTIAIMGLWGHGTCVFIGRGATHIVSHRKSLAVRTVAPVHRRILQVQDMMHVGRHEAERLITRTDAEREAFIRRYFGRNIDDPLHYDLVLNTAGLDTARAAAIIVEAFRQKFAA